MGDIFLLVFATPSGYYSSMSLIAEKTKENDKYIWVKNIIKIGEFVEGNKIQISLIPDSFLSGEEEMPLTKSVFVSMRPLGNSKNEQFLKQKYEKVLQDLRVKAAGFTLATPEDLKNLENKE